MCIRDRITIDADVIKIEKLKKDKISKTSIFKTYWSKIYFTKQKNKSLLTIRESNREIEVGSFLHTEIKESLYLKLKKYFG